MQQIIKSDQLVTDIGNAIQNISHDKLFILTDKNTHSQCLPLLMEIHQIRDAIQIVIPADDTNKTLENLANVWRRLTENGATRHSLLLNLGGGMVTDLGGFAAATFKRGIRYINVSTTLLGAVDAAVGGKTGINFGGYKNEIGSFYPSETVIISSAFFFIHSTNRPFYRDMLKW